MSKFVLTTQLNIQAPNLSNVVKNLNKQLGNVSVNLNIPNAQKVNKQLSNANKNLQNTAKSANQASTSFKRLGAEVGKSIGYLIRYDIARKAINLFANAIEQGLSDAIKFERELVKIAQVTGKTTDQLKGLTNNITKLSTEMGVSSMSLLKASRILAQTGMEADKVSVALKTLAQTTLAPTFDNLTDTTETAIAAMRQFRLESEDLDRVLGGINKVAGSFAVEAGDIGVAIRRAGGAFRSAGGEIEELIALFTSVRSTTRETAETIATGFRTIFTRLQRPTTIKFLEQFGVKLQDLNGKFVGPYEAVRRLNMVLKDLDPKDIRYSMIIEQLGGFRQVSKVIPLIQEFKVAQEALNVAQAGSGSLAVDAAKAQDTFAVKIDKLKEEVKELFRVITESTAFKVMLDGAIAVTTAITNLATALGPIIPMLTAMFAIKGLGAIGSIGKGIAGGFRSGRGYARGGIVPGSGTGDTVPAMLTPGEFVIRKSAVQAFGPQNLHKINKYGSGGPIKATGEGLRKYGYGVGMLFNKEGDRDWDHQKGTPWKRRGSVVNQFGLQDEFTATNSLKYIDIDGRKLQSGAAAPHVLAYKNAKDNMAKGRAWEQVLLQTGIMSGITGVKGRPLDGKIGGKLGDAALTTSSHSNSAMAEKLVRHHFLSNESGFLNNKASQYGKDTYGLGDVAEFLPSAATHAKLMSFTQAKKVKKKATGGAITAQGTDSVPALLTPGEFVINKKSAQSIGYDKLYGINRFAKGGVVGGSRLKMFGGGGPMDMLMMMMGMNMGGGGGGVGGGASNAGAQLNNLAKTTKTTTSKFKAGLGTVTDGLGKVATSSLITYSKIQFMGTAIDSTLTALGVENETIHKVVAGLTDFVSIVWTAGMALQALNQANIVSGIKDMFGAVGGPQMLEALRGSGFGSTLETMALLFADKIIKPVGGLLRKIPGVKGGTQFVSSRMGQMSTAYSRYQATAPFRKGGATAQQVADRAARFRAQGKALQTAKAYGPTQALRNATKSQRMLKRADQLSDVAKTMGASKGLKGLGLGKLAKVTAVLTVAFEVLAYMAGNYKDSQKEAVEEARKAGASWEEVSDTAMYASAGRGVEAFSEAKMITTIGKAVVRTGARWAARATATTASTAGTAFPVEVALLILELGYACAMAVDEFNNMQADFDAANFADKQAELASAFGHFKDGTLSAGAMANKLSSTYEANAERQAQLTRDSNTGSLFGIPGTGGFGFWGRDNDLLERDQEAFARAQMEQKEMAPEVASGLMEELTAAMRKGAGGAGGAAGAGSLALGGMNQQVLENLAKMLGISLEALNKQFQEHINEMAPVIQAEKEFSDALEAMARSTQAAMDIIMGIRSMAPVIEGIQARFANIQNQFAGGVGAPTSASMSSQFSTEALTSISTSQQFAVLASNAEFLASSLGVAGDLIKDQFLGGVELLSELPDALETLKNDLTNLSGDTSDPGDRVMSVLEERIGKTKFDAIPQEIKDRVRTKINTMDLGDENFEENFDAILEDATAAIEPYLSAMQEAAAMADQYNKILGSAYAQRAQMELAYIDGQMKIVNLMSQGEDMIREARGGKLTAADSAQQFQRRQEAQLGAGRVTGAVRGKGGQLASGMSVGGLGNLYNEQQKELRDLNKQLNNTTGQAKKDIKARGELNDKINQLQIQTEKTKKALESYTNLQQRAAGIQAELSREQEARQAKRKSLTDFTFASDEDRAAQVSNMRVGLQAAAAGDLSGVASEDRAAVGQFLDQFENVSLAAFGGKTGGEIKKEMEIAELENVMGRELSADEKKQIMESTSKEDQLISELERINKEAITAQEALNEKVGEDITAMTDEIARLNAEFLTNLQQILGARQAKRLAAEMQKAEKGVKETKAKIASGEAALRSIGLDPSSMSQADKDTALSALTKNKELIERAKTAQGAQTKFQQGAKALGGANLTEASLASRMTVQAGGEDYRNDETWNQAFGNMANAMREEGRNVANQMQGPAKEAAMKAASDLENAMLAIEGEATAEELFGNNPALRRAFEHAGFDTDMKGAFKDTYDEGIDATDASEILHHYMKSTMAKGEADSKMLMSDIRTAFAGMGDIFNDEVIGRIMNNEVLADSMKNLLPDTTFSDLNTNLTELSTTIGDINSAQADIGNMGYSPNEPKPVAAITRATGGPVYASRGMFIPKGTDTVPAMLTPGEFVIRRNAVKAVGLPLLQRINNMGRGGRQGGNGYYANGGTVGTGLSLDFSGLDASINRFSQQVDRMSQALAGGFSVNVGGEITVNVRLNGAEMLEGAKGALGQLAHDKVTQGITNMLKQHFPQINAGGKGIPGKQEQPTQYG